MTTPRGHHIAPDAFSLFAPTPGARTHRDDIKSGVRGFPAGRYIVYYREISACIVIARVIHGMRDQMRAFEEEQQPRGLSPGKKRFATVGNAGRPCS